ncbi:MAG TPA: MOSC domain-containing protein [Longimicrobium sp.]|nr:MOSC domain-containing protein [Longimicrobium sp.]
MKLLSIQVALPREHGRADAERAMDRAWTTAFFKEPVSGPVFLARTNLDGDRQADPEHHGGSDKAVLAYAASHYPLWRQELGRELPHGGFGENFTVEGMDESTVCIGDVYAIGEARVQVSQPRIPCWKIARRWGIRDFSARVQRTRRTGWYLRVLVEGHVQAGDDIVLLDRPHPDWAVLRVSDVLYARPHSVADVRALAEVPALATGLSQTLERYFAQAQVPPDEPRLVGPNSD